MANRNKEFNFKDYAIIAGLTLGALALIPLFAVFGLALQFVFVLVMPALLVGSAVYALTTRAEVIVSQIQGIAVPSDVRMHSGHGWARRAAADCVVAGADDFAQRVIGRVDTIETVPVGVEMKAGDVMAVLRRGEREIPICAPVDGHVSSVNPLLGSHPDLVNRSPYGRGWLVEIAPDASSSRRGLRQLRAGARATRWMRREVDRLVTLTAPNAEAPTLADGGELSSDVCSHLDEATWRRLVAALFP